MIRPSYLIAILFTLFAGLACNAQQATVSLLKTFPVKSPGGWDYLAIDPTGNNLYVSHGTQVNILNKTTGDSVGILPGTIGVHGIAFAPESGKGFISNGKLNNVFVFDPVRLKIVDSIQTGENPDAMCYDPYSKKLLVGNGHSNNMTVIDPATNKAIATIPLDGKPEASVSDAGGHVFVDIENKNEIAVIDTKTMKVVKHYTVAPGEEPAGLAIDRERHRLFAGCGNQKMVVLDANTGSQLAVLPIGAHCDGVAFDPATGNAYAANGEGSLTIVHEAATNTYKVIATAATQRGARTIAIDPATHFIYLPTADFEPQQPGNKERPKTIPGTFRILVMGKP